MFQDVFEMFEATFEVYLEDRLVNKQSIQAPKEILMVQFMQLYQQIAQEKRPMKVSMVVPQVIWDNFDNTQKTLNNEVAFWNNAMVSFEENKQTEQREDVNG